MDWRTAYKFMGDIVDVLKKDGTHFIGAVDEVFIDDTYSAKDSILIDTETTSFPSKSRVVWEDEEVLLKDVESITVVIKHK